jgi:hypothetical protein
LFIYAYRCLAQSVVSTSKSASSDPGDTRRACYSSRTHDNAGDSSRTGDTGDTCNARSAPSQRQAWTQ